MEGTIRCRRRGVVTVPLVMSLVVLLVLMGFAGHTQVSSVRACLEQIHAERVMELAADSAVEEACARLESAPSSQGFAPPPAAGRDAPLAFPPSVTPALAAADARELGVEIAPVAVRASGWKVDWRADAPGTALVRERAVVEFTVTVTPSIGRSHAPRTFRLARYAEISPDPGQGQGRLRFQHNNMVFRAE